MKTINNNKNFISLKTQIMKTAKIILSTGLVLCAALFTQAQVKSPVTFGLRAGVNFQNINGKDFNDNKMSNDVLTGYHIGANVEIPIATDFYVQPGLLYTTKGATADRDFIGQEADAKTKLSYLEVPVNFLYKPVLGSGKLLLGFGPYVAFGLGGKTSFEGAGQKVERDVKFQNTVSSTDPKNQSYYRKVDAGANLLFGYEFSNRLSAQLNAQLGLAKINPEYEYLSGDKSAWKNTGFGVSVGYRF